ncbi:malate synthase A [Streptomyces clavuligerus]|uniref:Malate synthase n=2 Tax=Streptomyces clavuligerus TaxID=1901 RepID=D5SKH2_STRCL|nr:malate synthase A [Streptomyces clavuligerus]ANW22333.1 malate synthase A [Streptomyces clavuligerus]AXU17233.1 malate synthase A [Streptomyces clavuligerus]EFG04415.1 Malate synthase [Streptomyces clavuligerus]MBY6307122.1 malate synthase A [Streptomyces clavuligerus]QCS10302.1 malate synthase A [Streptomyces clavuligerus]
MTTTALTHPVHVLAAPGDRHDEILTPAALEFVGRLADAFTERREDLLRERRRQALRLVDGAPLEFPMVTSAVRADPSWRVAPPAPGLADRRVEITGPPDRRMTVNALTSGARVWMADFEDATAPTWSNIVGGQLNLLDAVERRIDFTAENGKEYRLPADGPLATIMVRPRGWHLDEEHLSYQDRPLPAALVDFGLYVHHCAQRQIDAGAGPYFYLPKLESRHEARLWNEVFVLAQDLLGIPRGTIRATVLIETITAAFEMEEILYELREHSAGLNAGRWDYLFSLIKNFGHRPDFVLPDRAKVTMTAPFLRAYTELLVQSCHRRGAHAIGGMAAQVPGRDPAAREAVLATVRLDKEREAEDGFDGSWVAHPGLVPVCRAVFDGVLGERPHQIERSRDDVEVTAADLLSVRRISGPPTPQGLRVNVAVALRYFAAWLDGRGAVALNGLMEDAATAEIARVQIWQWLRHGMTDRGTVRDLVDEELSALGAAYPWAPLDEVRATFERTALAGELIPFFTPDAYSRHLVRREGQTS